MSLGDLAREDLSERVTYKLDLEEWGGARHVSIQGLETQVQGALLHSSQARTYWSCSRPKKGAHVYE